MSGFFSATILDAQHEDCPEIVRDDVRKMWMNGEYGNGDYVGWDDGMMENYPHLAKHIDAYIVRWDRKPGDILIHWWW